MSTHRFLAALGVLAAVSTAPALAGGFQQGSLLVYPCFDNRADHRTLITVTNTNSAETVRVEFVYINGYNCIETNRTRTLTPNDVLGVLTKWDNPNMDEGFLYVFAKDTLNRAIKFDWLVGGAIIFRQSGGATPDPFIEYPAVSFKGRPVRGTPLPDGTVTDIENGNGTGDGLRDLNNIEYEAAPEELLFDRFLGQNDGEGPDVESELVLLNLTGSARFDVVADLQVYNDNEVPLSAQVQFRCWTRKRLLQINGVFGAYFLQHFTDDNPNEVANGGQPFHEVGWFRVNGGVANSTADFGPNAALLGLLIHVEDSDRGMASLPFCSGINKSGDLINLSIFLDDDMP